MSIFKKTMLEKIIEEKDLIITKQKIIINKNIIPTKEERESEEYFERL